MAIKRVISAGGIVVKDGKILIVQHSKHLGWDFPKGHIEAGETAEVAAIREVEEETGVKAEVLKKAGETNYFFTQDGEKISKTVIYFLMKYKGEGIATTAYEVSSMVWLPIEEVGKKLTFKDTKRLWNEIKSQLLP